MRPEKAVDNALIVKLNRQVVFLKFECSACDNCHCDYAVADYFDYTLKVTLPKLTKFKGNKACLFSVELTSIYEKEEVKRLLTDIGGQSQWNSLKDVIDAVNQYVQSRPFTIVKYSKGQYILLDPNGFDYIGEYVTLADAKRTCGHNFKLDYSIC